MSQPQLNTDVPEVKIPAKPTRKTRKKRKLDEQKQGEVCAMISVGCSRRTAARLVGCSGTAIWNLARSDPKFAKRLRNAEIQREIGPLRNIVNAGQTRWRAAAWLLERLNPQEYARRPAHLATPEEMRALAATFAHVLAAVVQDQPTRQRLLKAFETQCISPQRQPEIEAATL